MRGIPGFGLYHICAVLDGIGCGSQYVSKKRDTLRAWHGPALLWLHRFPVKLLASATQCFYKLTRDVQHQLLSHEDLRVKDSDSKALAQCKTEMRNLLVRVSLRKVIISNGLSEGQGAEGGLEE